MSFTAISYVLNVIGMVSSLICLLLFIFLASRNIKFVNRITFKLQAALSLADFLFHLFAILSWDEVNNDKLCSFYGFAKNFSKSTYYCIIFMTTLNLHINVLSNYKFKNGYVKYLWAAIVIFPVLHTVPLYALGIFGKDANLKCFISGSELSHRIVLFTNLIIPITICFAYCAVVASMIFIKTIRSDKIVQNMIEIHHIQNDTSKVFLKKLLNNWILRIILYPVAFCLIHSGVLVDFLAQIISKKVNKNIFYWSSTGTYLSGLFNLIVFLCDPYFQSAIKVIFNRVIENSECFGESLNFPGEPPRYEMEVQSLASKDSRASSFRRTPTLRRRYYNNNQQENDILLRDMTKDL